MTDKIINKVLSYIDTIGGIVSEGAKQGYMIMVRQEFAKGFMYALIAIMIIALVGVLIRIVYKAYEKNKDGYDSEDWRFGLGVSIGIGSAVTIGMLFLLGNGILHIVNPQYYAIQEILNTLK